MFKILRANKIDKGSLKFTLDISIAKWGGFCIYGIQIFEKDGRRWISFPSKKVELPSGETRFLPYVRFEERTVQDQFSAKVMESFEAWIAQGNRPQEYQAKEPPIEAPRPSYGAGSGDSYNEIPF